MRGSSRFEPRGSRATKETVVPSAATSRWFVTGPASSATPAARRASAADSSQGSPGPSLPAGAAVMRQKLGVRFFGAAPHFLSAGMPARGAAYHGMSIHLAPAVLPPEPASAAAPHPLWRRRFLVRSGEVTIPS